MYKNREMQAILLKHGYLARPGRGDHQVWTHHAHPKFRIVLCGDGGRDALKYQERRLRNQISQLLRGKAS